MKNILASALGIWLLAGLFIPVAVSETDLSEIQMRLLKSDMLRANFQQEKNLRALSRPLMSEGELLFIVGEGALWQVVEPFAVAVLMKSDEIIEWDSEGEMRRLDTSLNPVLHALGEIILATLAGDTQFLKQHFEVSPTILERGWGLFLKPKSEQLGAVISDVQIFGDHFVEQVQISETNGDVTKLQFSDFGVGPFELNEFEKRHFAQ